MSNKLSRLERLKKQIGEAIDARREALRKGFELDNPRPFGMHQLSPQEQLELFASLPDAEKVAKFQQMNPAEQQEVIQGLYQRGMLR